MRRLLGALLVLIALSALTAVRAQERRQRRHSSPVENQTTMTQAVNETRNDTSRINAAIRARSTHYHRDDGFTVYIDTVTGQEWVDSTQRTSLPKMKYPLLMDASVGVNIWDPVMRLFGQKHGLVGFTADVNMHNRYFPSVEVGLGAAHDTPSGYNYTYRSPMSVYFKLGADYNFLYNSNPDYKFLAGVRYGLAPFSWQVTDVTMAPGYWDDPVSFSMPSQNATVGWFEFSLGLRVKLAGNIHAGWAVRFHGLLHETKSIHGKPWYIPGFGSRGGVISGSFTISYTLPINKRQAPSVLDLDNETITGDEPVPADTVAAAAVPAVPAE